MKQTQIFTFLFSSLFSIFEQIMQNFVRDNFCEEAIEWDDRPTVRSALTSSFRKCNKIENRTDGAASKMSIYTIWSSIMLQPCRLAICPDTVLLFELRIENPALRVTVQTFLTSRDAEAYAFGVRHVAPSPPGEERAGGAMLRATGMRRPRSFRSDWIWSILRSESNPQRSDVKISTLIRKFRQILIKFFFKKFFTFFRKFLKNSSKFWTIGPRAISHRFSRNFACTSAISNYIDEQILKKFECMELLQKATFLLSSISFIFWKNWAELNASITFRITYRPKIWIAQNHRLNELSPEKK